MTRRLLLPLLLLVACADAPADTEAPAADTEATTDAAAFGQPVPEGDALSPDALIADAETYAGATVLVEGVAREVCQQAGCWLTFSDAEGRMVRINVPRDESESYVYTFPKDASGRTVRVTGVLDVTPESVEDQRHYAEDRGASPEQIAAITEPTHTLVLTALGAELVGTTPAG